MRAVTKEPTSLTTALQAHIAQAIAAAGGWIGFDRFMALALYTPGLGYYAGELPKFGAMPASGSDFVTAPELTPLFGQTLAAQVGEALRAHRHRRGLGVRRRLGRAGAAAARRAGRRGAPLHHRRPVGQPARAPAGAAGRARRQAALGGRAAGHDARAWSSATRCSTPCRSSCSRATAARRAASGTSAAWRGGTAPWPGQTGPPTCARRSRSRGRTTT